MNSIAIAGGGLVGSLLSLFLSKKGHQVSVYEKRPDLRSCPNQSARSINLAISERGWKALRTVGLEEEVKEIALPMRGRIMHDKEGNCTFQSYGQEKQAIYSVSRSALNNLLVETASKEVTFHFEHEFQEVVQEGQMKVLDNASNEERLVDYDVLFAADGANSKVRQHVEAFEDRIVPLGHSYKELCILPADGGGWRMANDGLHIWPRGSFMLIALPNLDGSFTATLFLPDEGENSFEALNDEAKVKAFFEETFPDVLGLMPNLLEEYFSNPVSKLGTVKCYPWVHGNVALIGDAAHGIVPFYGQGMNAGFEDCSVLHSLMYQYGDDWEGILDAYQRSRKPDADAIAELTLNNFIEMRDRVADQGFLLRKRIEQRLSELYPAKWMPLYSMVTFSQLPYSYALKMGQKQREVMDEVMRLEGISEKWLKSPLDREIEEILAAHHVI